MTEWALLVFTICLPIAIGGFVFLAYANMKISKSEEEKFEIFKLPLISLLVISLIGLAGSFFHLGSPLIAYNTLLGFGKSWMSNEIILTSAFIGLAALTIILAFVQKKVNNLLVIVTAIIGLVDVFAMSKLYVVTQVAAWDHINTYLVFYGTTFTLGPVMTASLLSIKLRGEELKSILKAAFVFAIFGIAIQVIGAATLTAIESNLTIIGGLSIGEILAPYGTMIATRWILQTVGLLILGLIALFSSRKVSYSGVYVALIVLIIAEGMSRYLFYVIGS